MRCADLYTKTILTVIAALLAWNTVGQFSCSSRSSPIRIVAIPASR